MDGRHKRGLSTEQLRAKYRCYKQQTDTRGQDAINFEDYESDYVEHAIDALDDDPEDTLERNQR